MTETEAPERYLDDLDLAAERGINLLDEHVPGWRSMVNFDTIVMDDPGHCVLGQVAKAMGSTYCILIGNLYNEAVARGDWNDDEREDYDPHYWFATSHGFDNFAEWRVQGAEATPAQAADSWRLML